MAKDFEETDWDNWEYNENDDGTSSSVSQNDNEEILVFKDSNGVILKGGETVVAIKDLPVKGGQNIKRGDKFKNIKLTDEEGLIESGKMVLKTEFFKKI
ncbi:MAG: PhnA domain-containing protein [Candidatus Gracilibacteria bacterium]|nr:PhnA domain-containing protein [Candidatus Gracilibacteria bacterium]MDQ7022366.1 PhnA domain-containing protein [Candidatus Gracilibacteria bacterium]